MHLLQTIVYARLVDWLRCDGGSIYAAQRKRLRAVTFSVSPLQTLNGDGSDTRVSANRKPRTDKKIKKKHIESSQMQTETLRHRVYVNFKLNLILFHFLCGA